ncbi:MAG: transglutaminase family protein [Clostridiales bacterium]|nr:transglutaminase family protein [Clostridiales bacterium]
MKTYAFVFKNKIIFSKAIENQNFILKCVPMNYSAQRIFDEEVLISPSCKVTSSEDSFGNYTRAGFIKCPHKEFEYNVCGKALLGTYMEVTPLERLFLFESQMTKPSDEIKAFAKTIPLGETVHETALNAAHAVYEKMSYVPFSTNVETTAAEAFSLGKGVCQDYSHITIAVLRQLGIAARYAAGLMEGEGETHAWVDYYADNAWYGVDPTNDKKIDYGYIKISHGRDSKDCEIEKGVFTCAEGIVDQKFEISVKVVNEDD